MRLPGSFATATGHRVGVTGGEGANLVPAPPADWAGTQPEWAVYWAHGQLGLQEGRDFVYRQGLLGKTAQLAGGVEVDFYELDPPLGINIQGEFWHYEFGGAGKQMSDKLSRVLLENQGIPMVLIDETDANADPLWYLKEALAGRDHSAGGGRGIL